MAVKGFDLPMEEEDMAKMELRQFGPIHHCVTESKPFTVLTGPQASGKSTILDFCMQSYVQKSSLLDHSFVEVFPNL